jgi:hypothetical protein
MGLLACFEVQLAGDERDEAIPSSERHGPAGTKFEKIHAESSPCVDVIKEVVRKKAASSLSVERQIRL